MGCGLLSAELDLKIARPHSGCYKSTVTAFQYSRSASILGSRCKNYNNLNTLPQNATFTTIHTSFCQSDILPSNYSLRSWQTLQLTAPITTPPVKLPLFIISQRIIFSQCSPQPESTLLMLNRSQNCNKKNKQFLTSATINQCAFINRDQEK